jgi:formylmethanofuran dehydrogenase subunit E-like metal-binding protein
VVEDAKAGAMAVWDNPDFRGKPVVWDFRLAQLDVDAAGVREIARFILTYQSSSPPPKVAFVTAREVDFGMARMLETYRENRATEVHVFREYEPALSWVRPLVEGS